MMTSSSAVRIAAQQVGVVIRSRDWAKVDSLDDRFMKIICGKADPHYRKKKPIKK